MLADTNGISMIYSTAIIISIFALALKAAALIRLRGLLWGAPLCLLVPLISFVGMNIIELAGFHLAGSQNSSNAHSLGYPLLIAYYVLVITGLHSLLVLALINTNWPRLWWTFPLAIFFITTQIVTIVPGLGIDGIKHIGYSGTRIPGKYYFIIQIGLILPALAVLIVSVVNIVCGDADRRQVGYLHLFSFLPIIAALLFIILLMALDVRINASAIISLSVCLPVWFLLYSHSSTHRSEFITKWVRWSPESKHTRKQALLDQITKQELIGRITNSFSSKNGVGSLEGLLDSVESSLILEALDACEGNRSKAADMLKMERNKMLRRMRKHELD